MASLLALEKNTHSGLRSQQRQEPPVSCPNRPPNSCFSSRCQHRGASPEARARPRARPRACLLRSQCTAPVSSMPVQSCQQGYQSATMHTDHSSCRPSRYDSLMLKMSSKLLQAQMFAVAAVPGLKSISGKHVPCQLSPRSMEAQKCSSLFLFPSHSPPPAGIHRSSLPQCGF